MKTDQALIELSRASSKVAALTRAIGEAMKCSYEAQTANGGQRGENVRNDVLKKSVNKVGFVIFRKKKLREFRF